MEVPRLPSGRLNCVSTAAFSVGHGKYVRKGAHLNMVFRILGSAHEWNYQFGDFLAHVAGVR